MKYRTLRLSWWVLAIAATPLPVQADFAEDVQNMSSKSATTTPRFLDPPMTRLEEIMAGGTLAGSSVLPFIKRLIIPKDEFQALKEAIGRGVHWEDMLMMTLLGWLTVPSLRWPYQHLPDIIKPATPFRSTVMFILADHLQQIARIALVVYFVDIFKMLCIGLGFDFCKMSKFPHAFAQIAYTCWATERIAKAKKMAIRKYVSQYPDTFGRMQIVNRLVNAALFTIAGFIVLNILKLEMGVAMHSIFALGSISTLALGIASQGIFAQILNGLLLVSSDRIYEGDVVRFMGGKLEGTIVKLGWMETIIRGSDEIVVSVPNNDLARQQVSNLSRIRQSQVKTTLRFNLKDADALPHLLVAMKLEIVEACPAVITDGTRPFRVVWSDYGPNFLQVDVDVHLRVKPIGDEYWNNRQRILQAIRTAVKKNDLKFLSE